MPSRKFSIKDRIKSFAYAFNGIKLLIRNEHNAQIHLFITVLVIVSGFFFKIDTNEWIQVTFAIGLVLATEALNAAIEKLADFASPEKHELIKQVKDLAAGAVLLSAIAAAVIGLLIFLPKIISYVE